MKISNDLLFTATNKLWKIVSGPLVLIFIPLYLTPVSQGYWFTFISISALATFADLGFTNIVLQFSAHEFAFLSFDENFTAVGSELHLKRLSSFFIFTFKWSLMMVIIAFPLIFIAGIVMFSKKNDAVSWLYPWLMYVTGSGIIFFNNSLLSFFEGCNQVGRVQRIRFEIAVLNTVVLLAMLYLGCGLYSIATAMLLSSLLIFVYLLRIFGKFIRQLLAEAKNFHYPWKPEFLRLFWKYALSWSSGFFIFQIYTPIMFHFHGAIEAGKIGITMTLWSAAFNISIVWLLSVTPRLNMFVSKKDWTSLDKLFKRKLSLAVFTFMLGIIAFFTFYILTKGHFAFIDKIFNRFMGIIPIVSLAISWFLVVIIWGLALYLRSHKQEPLVFASMFAAFYILLTTSIIALTLPSDYIFLGFLTSNIIQLFWTIHIYRSKKKAWHKIT